MPPSLGRRKIQSTMADRSRYLRKPSLHMHTPLCRSSPDYVPGVSLDFCRKQLRQIPPTSIKSITCAGLCGTPGQPRMSNHLDDQLNQLNQYVFELVDLIALIDLTDACRNQLNQLNQLHCCGWAAHLTSPRFTII